MTKLKPGIYIAPNRHPWAHELHVAEILARTGHCIEFLPESLLPCADIRLDGIEYEIKSPETAKFSSIEQLLRKALKQSPNIIIDSSRCKIQDDKLCIHKCRQQKQIKRMLLITKRRKDERLLTSRRFLGKL